MSKYSNQVVITIEDFTKNVVYYDFKVEQEMLNHHYISFIWQYTASTVISPEEHALTVKKYIGNEIIITFTGLNGIKLMCKGKICCLNRAIQNGSHSGMELRAISHTVVLDDLRKARTFSDRNLQDIALKILPEAGGEFYQLDAIKPTYKRIFECKAQFNETSFNFLKRLATQYGQWLYWDGMRMQFGQIKVTNILLINGASLHNFDIKVNLTSHKSSFGGYDYKTATRIRDSQGITTTSADDSFAAKIRQNQAAIAQPELGTAGYANNAQNASEITEMVKLQTAGKDANSVFYSGTSYTPIGVGQVFTIQNINVKHEVVAIEVVHHSEVNGNYNCVFKAIPADVGAPHYTDVEVYAKGLTQPALVTENNDPEAIGRIQVDYYWGQDTNKRSGWIRYLQPYAGSGRGFYWIPEIGDEVLIQFEGNNADYPYAVAAHYNGKAKSGYAHATNDIKAIQTRSGIKDIWDDGRGSRWMGDAANSFVSLDGKGNGEFKVSETLRISFKNIIFTGNHGEFNLTDSMIFNITRGLFVFAVTMEQKISGLAQFFSGKTLMRSANQIKIESSEMHLAGQKKLLMHSDEEAVLNSKGTAKISGTKGNSYGNKADDYEVKEIPEVVAAIVEFRTDQSTGFNYNAEAGFDWLRVDDQGNTTEPPYERILLGGYEAPNGTDTNSEFEANEKAEAFAALEKMYNHFFVTFPTEPKAPPPPPYKYYVPWLNLYPKTASCDTIVPEGMPELPYEIELRVLVNVYDPVKKEDPDQIRVFFNSEYFLINGLDGTDKQPVLITDKAGGTKRECKEKLKITCIKPFNIDQEIVVYVYPKGALKKKQIEQISLRKMAGKIIACANDEARQKTQKIVLVRVSTNANNVRNPDKGTFDSLEKINLYKSLHQALIHPVLEEYEKDAQGNIIKDANGIDNKPIVLDLTTDPKFKRYNSHGNPVPSGYIDTGDGGVLLDKTDDPLFKEQGLFIYLKEKFNQQTNNKYNDCFPVFSFGIDAVGGRTLGRAQYIGVQNVIVFQSRIDARDYCTLNHEVLHGLGLRHTHLDSLGIDVNQKFVFENALADSINSTDNVMSYQTTTRSSWHWQWQIINP